MIRFSVTPHIPVRQAGKSQLQPSLLEVDSIEYWACQHRRQMNAQHHCATVDMLTHLDFMLPEADEIAHNYSAVWMPANPTS